MVRCTQHSLVDYCDHDEFLCALNNWKSQQWHSTGSTANNAFQGHDINIPSDKSRYAKCIIW